MNTNKFNLPMNTTTFQTKYITKAYTCPLWIFLTTIGTLIIPRHSFHNSQIGRGHLRHDGLNFKSFLCSKTWMINNSNDVFCCCCCI